MNLKCYAYRLPFTQPLKTSNHIYDNREGWIFCLEESNQYYFGEAAPLPGFSSINTQSIQNFIQQYIDEWLELLQTNKPVQLLQEHYQTQKTPPSLQFALDSVAFQLKAVRSSTTLPIYLFKNKSADSIEVNGLISLLDKQNVLDAVQNLVNDGFKTIKCKIGSRFQEQIKVLKKIQNVFPRLHIRLDTNKAWNLNQATKYLTDLQPLSIQYCEEPLADPSAKKFQMLNSKTSIPLALDESINKKNDWQALLPYCSVLIIKPMMIGNFSTLFHIQRQAQQANCDLVLTTSLESSIGRSMVALLASGIGSQHYAHGLNTGNILSQDTVPDRPTIKHGEIRFDTEELPIQADINHLIKLSTTTISSS